MATVPKIDPMRAALESIAAATPSPQAFTMRDHAVAEAARGPVFPLLVGGKTPRDKRFYDLATSDPEAVAAMWTDPDTGNSLDWNIGVLMGGDRLTVDVDVKGGKPGLASLETLKLSRDTLIVGTPTGGLHYRYSTPKEVGNGANCLGEGIDVRGHHGYVVGVGSVIDGKAYTIEHDAPVAEVPDHVLAQLAAPRERTADAPRSATELDTDFAIARAAKYLATEAPPAIEGAGGDDTTFRVLCIAKDMGVSEPLLFDLAAEHYNLRCSPPWPLEELEQKAANACAYALSAAGSQSPVVDFADVGAIPAPVYIQRAQPPSLRLRFLSDSDANTQPNMLVRRMLPEVGVVPVAGQSRTGKTFVALYMSTALSSGGEFFGHVAREQVAVLFIAAEAPGTIGPRLEALRRTTLGGVDPADIPIAWADLDDVPRPGDLAERVASVTAAIRSLAEAAATEMRRRFGLRLGVVVVDTVGEAFGVPDREDEPAKLVMSALGRISRELGVLVVPVMHFGKDDRTGITGSYYWTASADVILAITGDVCEKTGTVSDRRIAMTKNKIDEQGPISAFDLVQVSLGVDRDGFEVTSAVVAASAAKAKPERPSPHADMLVECFYNALVDKTVIVEGQPAAERLAVLALFKERKPGSKDSGNVSRAFAAAERWADVKVIREGGVDYLVEGRWPTVQP